ncbi:MAG: hypothetical protein FWD17_20020 [Polyangiaceae bacterium]|nr:hypothetical protein [Polyangiaceae bacterium]
MLLEDLLLAGVVGVIALFAFGPIARLAKTAPWRRRDPVAEAKERLRVAKLEAEAARLNREADRIYEDMYRHAVDDGREPDEAPEAEGPAEEALHEKRKGHDEE